MKDRFDLENEINELTVYSDQLNMVSASILDSTDILDKDHIVNALQGISILLNLHSDKMFDTMKQVFRLDNYKELV
jgi:hypothetical protein